MRKDEGEIAAWPLVWLKHPPKLGAFHPLVGQNSDPINEEQGENERHMRPDHERERGRN